MIPFTEEKTEAGVWGLCSSLLPRVRTRVRCSGAKSEETLALRCPPAWEERHVNLGPHLLHSVPAPVGRRPAGSGGGASCLDHSLNHIQTPKCAGRMKPAISPMSLTSGDWRRYL